MDRSPHSRAREDAWGIFERLSKLDGRGAIALGARRGPSDSPARDVHQHDWSGLTDREQVQAGLNLLVELHHLAESSTATWERGGRPTTTYTVNPRGRGITTIR